MFRPASEVISSKLSDLYNEYLKNYIPLDFKQVNESVRAPCGRSSRNISFLKGLIRNLGIRSFILEVFRALELVQLGSLDHTVLNARRLTNYGGRSAYKSV